MIKIKTLRGKILKQHFSEEQSNVEMTFEGIVVKVLTIPSYIETECCIKKKTNFFVIHLENDALKNDPSNIQHAIQSNLFEIPTCTHCKKKPRFKREFSDHVFVQVKYSIYSTTIILFTKLYFYIISDRFILR